MCALTDAASRKQSQEKPKNGDQPTRSSVERRRDSRDRNGRRRDDSRDRDRDRDRRRRSPDRRRRSNSRSRSTDRKRPREQPPRDPEAERLLREESQERRRERDLQLAIEREATKRQREIDDLTKDQRTIFIGQLTRKVGERELENFFGQLGKVRSVIMLRDKHSGAHKGFAYVEMADLEQIPNCLLFNNVVPDFQKFPILVKASEAEKNFAAKKEPAPAPQAVVDPETRLYVGNLNVNLDEAAIKLVLDQYGPTESIKIHRDSTGKSKGFAFVQYVSATSAQMAMSTLGGVELAGRLLRVGPVTDKQASIGPYQPPMTSYTVGGDAADNWKLDADEGSAGMVLNSQNRMMLMAKLGAAAGIEMSVPVPQTIMKSAALPEPAVQFPVVIPPMAGRPSTCLMLVNMFNAAEETEPNWDNDIKEDVTEECAKHGRVEVCKVETRKPGGIVYVRMHSIPAATNAGRALHGRYFAGRQIISSYQDPDAFLELIR